MLQQRSNSKSLFYRVDTHPGAAAQKSKIPSVSLLSLTQSFHFTRPTHWLSQANTQTHTRAHTHSHNDRISLCRLPASDESVGNVFWEATDTSCHSLVPMTGLRPLMPPVAAPCRRLMASNLRWRAELSSGMISVAWGPPGSILH